MQVTSRTVPWLLGPCQALLEGHRRENPELRRQLFKRLAFGSIPSITFNLSQGHHGLNDQHLTVSQFVGM
jgi:hypothetical protein